MHLPHATDPTTSRDAKPKRSRGQVLVMFAGGMISLLGIMAIVVDISWYWSNSLRVQRAADAAALAGAAYLPGNVPNAKTYALAEAKKNGYTDGLAVGGLGTIHVTPTQDATDVRQLDVTVSAPIGTFFMRVFGIDTVTASRTAKAVYVQPVPMGSPENYYGIYCLTTTTHSSCDATTNVPDATGSGSLASKGFWGAFQSSGDIHNEGDAFTPYNDTLNPGTNSAGGTNPDYSPKGYDYAVEVPANGGNIYIFDPGFCVVGGGLGSGDHYNADNNRQFGGPAGKYYSVSSTYTLYNTQGTAFTTGDDTLVNSSGSLFASDFASDQSVAKQFGDFTTFSIKPGATSLDGKPIQNCSQTDPTNTDPSQGRYWHDRWWPIGTNLPAGVYRVNVQSAAVGASNWKAQAENDFGIEVTGAAGSRVYGLGRMASYNILPAGVQSFYLAQIDKSAAGKTIEVDLFDPGDVSGNAVLKVKNPDGNVYNYATFSYTTFNLTGGGNNCIGGNSDACSATNRTQIQTASSGSSSFNNTWIRILIPLPSTYGSVGLTPPGETQAGWWKMEYTVSGGNDTTTWMVNIRGNPVHLIVP